MKSSDSVENYIKVIYGLSDKKKVWVNTNELAVQMSIKPSSVTDMLKKLDNKQLVNYQKYKGVKLTTEGNTLALRVIRKHRLWEVFLENKLGFNWDEVHDIAEQLEHISSPELVKRLDKFLDFPKYDPHGDPIPDHEGKIKPSKRNLLSAFYKGESGKLVGVDDSSSSFLKFLESKKLALGCEIIVYEKFDYDDSMDIKIMGTKEHLNISKEVSRNLYLIKNE